ncbi:hypothetical protein GCM10025734_64780 [Kitasatospora paranensis]
MRTLDDPGEGGGVHIGQWQAGEPQGEDLTETARHQEAVAGRSGLGLRDDAAAGIGSGSGHGGFEELRSDVPAALGRMDLEGQFGQVLLSGAVEQAQEGSPDGVESASDASQARRRLFAP